MFLWWCGCVFVIMLVVVVFLWWCGCVLMVVFLWWQGGAFLCVFDFLCDCVFGVVWLRFCGCVFVVVLLWREALEKRVVDKCWRRELYRSVGNTGKRCLV